VGQLRLIELLADRMAMAIEHSSFTTARRLSDLQYSEANDGLAHHLELHDEGGVVYAGPTPYLVERNVLEFLQRENGIREARRQGHRWKRRRRDL
jgi:hypothetical protein